MTKKEFLDDLVNGGIYLWDNECSIKWNNMPDDYRYDWMVLYDICQEAKTPHTDELFKLLEQGLMPYKGKYTKWLCTQRQYAFRRRSRYLNNPATINDGPIYGRDITTADLWYWPVGKMGVNENYGPNSQWRICLGEFITCPAPELYNPELRQLINTKDKRSWEARIGTRRGARKVYAFHSMREAWRFLFDYMVDKRTFCNVELRR